MHKFGKKIHFDVNVYVISHVTVEQLFVSSSIEFGALKRRIITKKIMIQIATTVS